jgi:hypothetical protein
MAKQKKMSGITNSPHHHDVNIDHPTFFISLWRTVIGWLPTFLHRSEKMEKGKEQKKVPTVYSTKSGAQYVNALEVLNSAAGKRQIDLIHNAQLVSHPSKPEVSTQPLKSSSTTKK